MEVAGETIRPGRPTPLFALPAGAGRVRTRDGERFLLSVADQGAPGPSLRLVLGWTGMLKR
jgi:hypothetical protein